MTYTRSSLGISSFALALMLAGCQDDTASHATASSAMTQGTAPPIDATYGQAGAAILTDDSSGATAALGLKDGSLFVALAPGAATPPSVVHLTADGKRDTQFSGVTTLNRNATFSVLREMPDGRILAIGTYGTPNGFAALVMFQRDGTPDPGFGTNGYLTDLHTITPFEQPAVFYTTSAAITADGKIILAGAVAPGGLFVPPNPKQYGMLLARLTGDGKLDPSFAQNGLLSIDTALPDGVNWADAVAMQEDGHLLIGATGREAGAVDDFAYAVYAHVLRFTEDGELDSTFGKAGGTLLASKDTLGMGAVKLRTVDDGSIYAWESGLTALTNAAYRGVAVIKLTAEGSVDGSFGDVIDDPGVLGLSGSFAELSAQGEMFSALPGGIGNYDPITGADVYECTAFKTTESPNPGLPLNPIFQGTTIQLAPPDGGVCSDPEVVHFDDGRTLIIATTTQSIAPSVIVSQYRL